jgi:hypothetical protein
MITKSVTLFPHQVEIIRNLFVEAEKYRGLALGCVTGSTKSGYYDIERLANSKILSIIKNATNNEDLTCSGKTVGEVASLYNLHLYKGGFVNDTSDSLYTGNLTGHEVVDKITKINDDGYIFLKLEDGSTVVIIGEIC